MPSAPPPRLSICAGAPSRRRRISCLTSPRHSSRPELYLTPSRNRGGRKRLADSLPPDGHATRPSPVPARHNDNGAPPSCTARLNGPRHPSLGSIAEILSRVDFFQESVVARVEQIVNSRHNDVCQDIQEL